MNEVELGKRLQKARQKAGMTQQEMCDKARLAYSTLAKIERGAIKSPSIFTVAAIAGVLGMTIDELLGIKSKKTTSQAPKKQSKSGTRFVYFDINGVLVHFFQQAFSLLAADTGVSADLIETTFWHYNDAACRGELTVRQFNDALAKQMNVSSVNWPDYYFEAIDPVSDMTELLQWAEQHYKVGLLSNIMSGFIDTLLDKKMIPSISYDAIIDSSRVGTIKPEPRIYEIAQQAAGVPASEILLIDDDRNNLMAAEKAGWHVLWFDDFRPVESAARIKQVLEF